VISTVVASAGAWLVLAILSIQSPVMVTLPVLCCDALGLGALLAQLPEAASRAAGDAPAIGLPCWLITEALSRWA
jgi:hypothetical protein